MTKLPIKIDKLSNEMKPDERVDSMLPLSTKEKRLSQMYKYEEYRSKRSASSPQLAIKPQSRSKVYRKTSLKSSTLKQLNDKSSAEASLEGQPTKPSLTNTPIDKLQTREKLDNTANETRLKWNTENVNITCNPLSTPYPYSTPCHKIPNIDTNNRSNVQTEDEPKSGRSCGSFLPILSLIPQTMVSLHLLSPKMKFSWWRNKIS
ncbi:uncharacterized protein [Venturia canescens]|uniref:uncharacterized protein n=1 Tax=Venturia canescens TaxID=32260 RepID=UPI001C9BEC92|nr:uncharacterized protein LOC122412860 [Venturia canescens]